ncbi:tripartite motif-containing protein 2-like [Glandiceps talaboti]
MATAKTLVLDGSDDNFLLCTICCESYKNAKCLPCLHNFCEPCLDKLVTENCITCPICRRSFPVPHDGVAAIDSNVFVNELVDLNKKVVGRPTERGNCEACEQERPVVYCVECEVAICHNCVKAHKLFKGFTNESHNLMSMDEYNVAKFDDPMSVRPRMYCKRHRNYEVEFYCKTCDAVACLRCTLLGHPSPRHECKVVKYAAIEYVDYIDSMLDRLKLKVTEAKESTLALEEVSDSLDKCYQKEQKRIKEHVDVTIDQVTRMIQENGGKLLRELRDEYNTKKTTLNGQLKELDCSDSDLSHTIGYVENLVRYAAPAEMMLTKKGVSAQMEELLKLQTRTDPIENDYMEFQPCDDFCKEKNLGVVITTGKVTTSPDYVRVGEDIVVTIETGTSQNKMAAGSLQVDSVMKTPDNITENVEVNDNKDGTLTVKTCTEVEGEHELSISVRNKPVKGSPVTVNVIPTKRLLRQFGDSGAGQLTNPCGVTACLHKKVLVTERYGNGNTFCKLQLYNCDGKHFDIFHFDRFQYPVKAYDSAILPDGTMFITDSGNSQVITCDRNGKFIRCFGQGYLQCPVGIGINPINGLVYVADFSAECMQIYNQAGAYVNSFKSCESDCLVSPEFLDFDNKGNVYVSDQDHNKIQVFDASGHFLYSFGSCGNGKDHLKSPMGVCLDKHGYVYVADNGNCRILKFESNGTFVGRVDSGGLSNPLGICIMDDDPFGKVIVADNGHSCIKMFAQ